MWKEFDDMGFLRYPNFLETVTQIIPMYGARVVGGGLYITGAVIGIWNIIKTVKSGQFSNETEAMAPALEKLSTKRAEGESRHRWLERKPVQFLVASLIVILIGGAIEIIPMYLIKSNIPSISSVKPYTPLELEGRDIYVREGCYTCHSQMIRPFRSETERYGEYSKAGEFVYDHPFQWGSKRNGPDLAREGVKTGKNYKPDSWHYNHMMDPRKLNQQSIMPAYPWLISNKLDVTYTPKKIRIMQALGTPYADGYDKLATADLQSQAGQIADGLKASGINVDADKEIIALIAYLQRLGTDISK
jgi:cytochrome c oxidase cbb3-type subunit I/II